MASEGMRDPKHYQLGKTQFDPDLIKEVEALGGKNAQMCYQCGTCTASCPMGQRSGLRNCDEKSQSRHEGRPRRSRPVAVHDVLHVLRPLSAENNGDGCHHRTPQYRDTGVESADEHDKDHGRDQQDRSRSAEQ